MKKLNRKGFTLVELLAVIIILAIVVGITIPAVLTTTKKASQKAFETAADTAADWFDRQYQVYTTGLNDSGMAKLDSYFVSACDYNVGATDNLIDTNDECLKTDGRDITVNTENPTTHELTADPTGVAIAAAAGLKASNIISMNVYIDPSTGRSCITLTASTKGDYKGAGENGTNTIESSNCQ